MRQVPSISVYLANRNKIPTVLFLLFFVQNVVAQSAILSTGSWYKIAITQTGVHKIDANFLRNVGVDISSINPQNIRIFGNGGAMLPQANHAPRPDNLLENAIEVVGENDTKFDQSDYILFFAESPHKIEFDNTENRLKHRQNVYSDTTHYFLTVSPNTKGLRIENQSLINATNRIESFDHLFFHELDQTNIMALGGTNLGGSGREWYGESFANTNSLNFELKTEGLIKNTPIYITSAVLGASTSLTSVNLKLNTDSLIGEQILTPISTENIYLTKGVEHIKTFSVVANGQNVQKLSFNFDKKNALSSQAYLNYFEVQTKRKLQFYEQQILVYPTQNQQPSLFVVDKTTANHKIWDVTTLHLPKNINFQTTNTTATFGVSTTKSSKFVLFSNNNLFEPHRIEKIDNQYLRNFSTPDLLIIAVKEWKTEAERLADFRRKNDNLDVAVVSVDEVFNEFSSGSPDPTAIRDFGRFLWLKNPQKLKYLLLFADASYDYKNLTQYSFVNLSTYIPTYESKESLEPVRSYSSDDYFGFFEENEGEWAENYAGNHRLAISIGRLPVKSKEEAKNIIDKLIYYENTKKTAGNWRTKISFVADDGEYYAQINNTNNIHQADADKIAETAQKNNSSIQLNKIYLDGYPFVATANGTIAPEANKAINKAVNDGSLVINYSGHGGIDGWTEEKIVTRSQIQEWQNLKNMPIFLTATCSFGRYDNPGDVSGAELALLSPKGAAIGLLTTSRPVYSSTNFLLNNAFYEAFAQQNTKKAVRLGDIFRITKNNSLSDVFNRNFTLLADPSMKLAYPTNQVVLTKINGKTSLNQPLKALSKVELEGEIMDFEKSLRKTDFNGQVLITVFDKAAELSTLGQKGDKFRYKAFRNKLFEGIVVVKNGIFSIGFVLPKDINYQLGKGRVNFYAINADSTSDAAGAFNDLLVGGSEENLVIDNTPPRIDLSVDKNNRLNAIIFDENGINVSQSGIGHEMILTLNDTLKIVVNDYYIANNDYKNGKISYNFGKLPEGKYTIHLKVWDTYNNSAQSSLAFTVNHEEIKILDVYNYPNPFTEQTFFRIKHNALSENLIFKITIFNNLGKTLFEKEESCFFCTESLDIGMKIDQLQWNIGTYFYRISVISASQKSPSYFGGKLIFLK